MLNLVGITPRERDLLPLIAQGWRNKQIAVELGLSEGTVRVHVQNILKKTHLRSRSAVAGAVAGTAAGSRDLVALVRRVAPDVVRITAAQDAGHLTPSEAQKLIESLVAAGV